MEQDFIEDEAYSDTSEDEVVSEDERTSTHAHGPRFDIVDSIFFIGLAVLGDIADSIWVPRLFIAPITILFLFLKGIDNVVSKNVIAQAVELVPVLGWLPISTTAALITVFATNHPEKFEKWFGRAEKVMIVAGKTKGK